MNEKKIKKLEKDYDNIIWADKKRVFGLPLSFTVYILTDKKLYVKRGFFNIREDNIDLYKVVDYTLLLPLGQRMFGCGSIKVVSHDAQAPTELIYSVKDARDVLKMFEKAVDDQRTAYNIRGTDMFGANA